MWVDLMFISNSIKKLVILHSSSTYCCIWKKRGEIQRWRKNNFFSPASWWQSMYKEFTQVKFERIYRLDLWHRLHSHEREVYKWDFKSLIPRAWTKRKKKRWNCRVELYAELLSKELSLIRKKQNLHNKLAYYKIFSSFPLLRAACSKFWIFLVV